MFLLAIPLGLRKINTVPHILAHINIECPDYRHSKFEIYISEFILEKLLIHASSGSRDSVVGIVTRDGLEGPRIESRWGEIFRTYPDRLRGPPSLLYNGYRVFLGVKAAGA
jgi:hypothetical protein